MSSNSYSRLLLIGLYDENFTEYCTVLCSLKNVPGASNYNCTAK